MRSQRLIAAIGRAGPLEQPQRQGPHATLCAAMLREIAAKDKQAGFRKTKRGKFEYAEGGK